MNKEVKVFKIPEEVKIEEKRLEFEKEFKKPKVTSKKKAIEKGAAFHDKSEKNSKVNVIVTGKQCMVGSLTGVVS